MKEKGGAPALCLCLLPSGPLVRSRVKQGGGGEDGVDTKHAFPKKYLLVVVVGSSVL